MTKVKNVDLVEAKPEEWFKCLSQSPELCAGLSVRVIQQMAEKLALLLEEANREAQPVGVIRHVATGVHASLFGPLPEGTELFTATPAPAYPETLPCAVRLMPGVIFGEGVRTSTMLDGLRRREEYNAEMAAMTPEQKAEHDAGHEAFKAMLLSRSTPAPVVNPEFTGAPAVPDEQTVIEKFKQWWSSKERGFTIINADLQKELQWEAWQDCCAAMLNHIGDTNEKAQPVSQGYKLPPHAYRELVNSLRDTAVKYQGTQQLREQLGRTLKEAGLLAAPEGGNG